MEIALKRVDVDGDYDGWRAVSSRAHEVELCGAAFNRHVYVPRDVNRIYAVFSKERPKHHQYWEIRRGSERAEFMIKYVNEGMLFGTASALADAWFDGYRYVWIEY